ncbi:MAG: sulfur carrier protein ThiS adenylyltransferase ThiF, partial [Candidatus Methanomethylophilus sp.]|nr:sulfur carrier protein ThiS adenylyltransferase ThiF [Methanomethylophilus sp.]
KTELSEGTSISELKETQTSDFIYAMVNGRHEESDYVLSDGDTVRIVKKGDSEEDISGHSLIQRYSAEKYERISKTGVGIAGLGGIGSHVAAALVRTGIKDLVIADFDCVDITNLSRQNYSMKDLGLPKSEATERVLKSIAPWIKVEAHNIRLTEDNVAEIFGNCDIVIEAFDSPEAKAMLVSAMYESHPEKWIVSCSGMAGFDSTSTMDIKRRFGHVVIVGDGVSDKDEVGLVATRVMTCAGMMAHTAVRLILEETV